MRQMLLAFICRHRLLRSPLLAALLFRLSLRPVRRLSPPNAKYRVLLMLRPGLTEDALSIFEDAPQFAALGAPQGLLKAVAANILADTIDEQNYVNLSPAEEESKRVYRAFLQRMLAWLLRLCRIDAIISGNFAYFAERELHAAAEALGLPFIVLHKENLKSEGRIPYFQDIYRNRRGAFTGRRIAVYNAVERQIQIAAGVVSPDRVSVCGMPRLDRAHAWRRVMAGRSLPARPTVLFFTFGVKTGLPGIRRKNELPGLVLKPHGKFTEPMDPAIDRLSWSETLALTMRALAAFATAHPQVRVVMKSKRGYAQQDFFRSAVGEAMPQNIEWVEEGDPLPLLKDAWAVLSMNSTAVLESLATGKIVLTPGFGEAGTEEMRPWLTDFGDAVESMQTPEQLVARLTQICTGPVPAVPAELAPAAVATLEHWSGNTDGKASERAREMIQAELAVDAKTVPHAVSGVAA
jgi:hypothetical protein